MSRGKGARPDRGANGSLHPWKAVHRHTFLQVLQQRGWMAEKDARDIYKRLCSTEDDTAYPGMIGEINDSLSGLEFEVRRIRFLVDNQWYIALVNKDPDEQSKELVMTDYTHAELAYFRAVLEAIAESPEAEEGRGCISSMDALNSASSASQAATQAEASSQAARAQRLSLSEKEALLGRLVAQGWLAHLPGSANAYTIGVRSFLALSGWLMSLDLPEATRAAWEKLV